MKWQRHWARVAAAGIVLVGLALGAGATRPATGPDEPAIPAALRNVGIDQRLNEPVPLDLVFHDEAGKDVRLSEFFSGHKPVVLTLVYYQCPMLCTLVLNDLVRALRAMPQLSIAKDFEVVTVSFNPRETPALAAAKKKQYVGEYRREGAAAGWHFLTGEQAAIERLTQAAGFRYTWDPTSEQYIHPTGIVILTPQGRIARYFFGIGYEPKDLRLSLVEASNNRIGTFTEQVLLYCFHYDPATGKYSLAVLNAVKAGGVIVLIAMGTMFYVLIRHERRRSAVESKMQNEKWLSSHKRG